MLDCDSSQIEARMVAWLSGQADLLHAFETGQDVYKLMGSSIYNKPVEDITDPERFVSKVVVLGCGYGMWHKTFRIYLGNMGVHISEGESEHIINVYRDKNYMIVQLWHEAQRIIEKLYNGQDSFMGPNDLLHFHGQEHGVLMPSGLWIRYEDLDVEINEFGRPQYTYRSRYGKTFITGAKLVENVSQALARCVVGEQMLRIAKRYSPALTVHDSVVIVVPEDEILDAAAYMHECMSWRPDWASTLPLACEVKAGRSYGRMKEIHV